VTVTSPLELLKTRVQGSGQLLMAGGGASQLPLAIAGLQQEAAAAPRPFGPVRVLWRGLSVSLAKDLPFAGLYWCALLGILQ
jgi:hypothetical protein